MWQAPPSRTRQQRKRTKEQKSIHIKRVHAELRTASIPGQTPTVATARIVLNDMSPLGVGLFTQVPFTLGQEIALTFEHPKRAYIRGKVLWCEEMIQAGKILSAETYKYRIGIQFKFQSKEDEAAIRAFCEEISADQVQKITTVAA
jgi:hypothetical protein